MSRSDVGKSFLISLVVATFDLVSLVEDLEGPGVIGWDSSSENIVERKDQTQTVSGMGMILYVQIE